MSTQKILILGAAGFIGQACLNQLLEQDTSEVRVLVRDPKKLLLTSKSQLEIIEGDIRDFNTVDRACAQVNTVIHAASKSIDTDNTGFTEVNVLGTQNVCQASIKNKIKKLIYISTCGVYGHSRCNGLTEHAPISPDTAFSRSKYEAEQIILTANEPTHFDSVILRPRFIYGEGDVHVIPRFLSAASKYPFVINHGQAKLSFIYINDLAKIITRFIFQKNIESTPVFNDNDGEPLSIKALYHLLHDVFHTPKPKYSLPYWPLYTLAKMKEFYSHQDPDKPESSLTSQRINFIARDNFFSNEKLTKTFSDFRFTEFSYDLMASREYYESLRKHHDAF